MFIKTNESTVCVRMMDCPAYGDITQRRKDVNNPNDEHTYEYIPFHPEDHSERPVFPDYEHPITT